MGYPNKNKMSDLLSAMQIRGILPQRKKQNLNYDTTHATPMPFQLFIKEELINKSDVITRARISRPYKKLTIILLSS